ncbi:aldehyde dehydrogenase family protein [Conexibacter sp. W3-3-2]|uniref:aldehyde dehydrogenase family protein n=1 Tax=Conexibacter sp. W3-3-2 TaxID=2675227 RepID=UPI0028154D32|nr:aldehyde dehydrogenase family protein [Conexibacter sp. W3-3-2]
MLTVVQGEGAAGAAVVDEVDMVMFTGSTATGRRVAEQAARRLIPCSLELGGKDAMIVCEDADLHRAARAAAFYALQNAGQICMSIERVYVEEPVHDSFVGHLVEQVRSLRQGHGGAGEVEVGAMTTAAQLELVSGHVQDALARGAVAVTGGRRGPGPGRFFEPTVLTGVDHSMLCMTEETFGPTIPVMAVGNREEAVRLANDSPYGLAASVFTSDARAGEALARRLEVGSVVINDALIFFGAPYLPMGGWKQSGIGVRHRIEGLHKYTRPQSIVVGRDWPVRDPHWFPYRPSVSRTLRQVLRLSARR